MSTMSMARGCHVGSYDEFVDWLETEKTISGMRLRLKMSKADMSPRICREKYLTYSSPLQLELCDDGIVVSLGRLPVMTKSIRCISREGEEEIGGYFIINGNEKVIRLLQMAKKNYPLGLKRSAFEKKGPVFTEYAVSIKCGGSSSSSSGLVTKSMVLHLLVSNQMVLSVRRNKRELLLPLTAVLLFLRPDLKEKHLVERYGIKAMNYPFIEKDKGYGFLIGSLYRDIDPLLFEKHDFEALATLCIQEHIAIHLDAYEDKFHLLVFMAHKLMALSVDKCAPDNADALANQDLLLPGHLLTAIMKEQLEDAVYKFKEQAQKISTKNSSIGLSVIAKRFFGSLGKKIENFLATGNLVSNSGLDLQQSTGFVVIADRLNHWRFTSHFVAVHRGHFFTTMKTTSVRKLLPESWGFLCPVHTPDGAPCGLLSHLAKDVVFSSLHAGPLYTALFSFGVKKFDASFNHFSESHIHVLVDGNLIGYAESPRLAYSITQGMRRAFPWVETAYFSEKKSTSPYFGLYIFSQSGRMLRPVCCSNSTNNNEKILLGPLEQLSLQSSLPTESVPLSLIAALTPFSQLNQSPRNIYQCQMAKQTMGTPVHAFSQRTDKLYRLSTPQSPLVSTHDYKDLDLYAQGTNAIIAVTSYTGYDMEDAMIIKKSSHDRGFGHGYVYKTKLIDLSTYAGSMRKDHDYYFSMLPDVGTHIQQGDDLFKAVSSSDANDTIEKKYDEAEACCIDTVRLLDEKRAAITLRYDRKSRIGDKYSSRHGQKGVLSYLMAEVDMPFTESGMCPDVIINPHAFPSRMTIGMLLEILAAKTAAVSGIFWKTDANIYNQDIPPAEKIGKALVALGYAYGGAEPVYSGISGRLLETQIFFGPVYYQRLRHMVSDKSQVRSEGPVHEVTRQPVKGRKRHGGIRLGEMERDALIAHGTSFILRDRLFDCSDFYSTFHCANPDCPSHTNGAAFFSPPHSPLPHNTKAQQMHTNHMPCRYCGEFELEPIHFPYIFRFLLAELAAMNCKLFLVPSSSPQHKNRSTLSSSSSD